MINESLKQTSTLFNDRRRKVLSFFSVFRKNHSLKKIEILHVKSIGQRTELWVARKGNSALGHVFIMIEYDKKIKLFDSWVHEDHRRNGIYGKLWEVRWNYILENYQGFLVYAWCKKETLDFFLEKGFVAGESAVYVEKNLSL